MMLSFCCSLCLALSSSSVVCISCWSTTVSEEGGGGERGRGEEVCVWVGVGGRGGEREGGKEEGGEEIGKEGEV